MEFYLPAWTGNNGSAEALLPTQHPLKLYEFDISPMESAIAGSQHKCHGES